MEEIVAVKDRTALLREGIAVVDAERKDGRLLVEVTGAPEERVRRVVGDRFGPGTRVTVVDDLPRRLYARPAVGHMEREEGRLQLRYVVWPDEHLADVVVEEDEDTVVVLGMICVSAACEDGDPMEVPTHVYLDAPLGNRAVVDGCRGDVVPYKNVWIGIRERLGSAEDEPPPSNLEDRFANLLRGAAESRPAEGG